MTTHRCLWRRAVLIGAALTCVMVVAHPPGASAAQPQRPNILFLLTDDQRVDTIGALGNAAVRTPHLDALAQRGFVFRNAYCQGSCMPAVCTPSRNMLITGQSFLRWGGSAHAPDDAANLPASMAAAGYQTYYHGKRQNTATRFERQFEISQTLDDDNLERSAGRPGQTIADRAIDFLTTRADPRPFCMWLSFEAPHDPRGAAPEDLATYDRDAIRLPANYLPLHPFDNGEMLIRDERLAPWPREEAEIRRHLHEYWAMITGLDRNIGRVLQALRDTGQYDNTLIVFASDHGLAIGSHGLMGKQNLYEHSMKAPLIFAGPGIEAGASDALVYLFDIFPTLCELTGADVPEGLDGKSLASVVRGDSTEVRDTVFLAYRDAQRAVRDGRWKMIRYPQIDHTQLFDLATDPDELHNLAGDADQAERVARMLGMIEAWQRELGDATPLNVPKPRSAEFVPPPESEGP
jgi:arylsulfatase A-like enzyme